VRRLVELPRLLMDFLDVFRFGLSAIFSNGKLLAGLGASVFPVALESLPDKF
jgi:hypothetical protein